MYISEKENTLPKKETNYMTCARILSFQYIFCAVLQMIS